MRLLPAHFGNIIRTTQVDLPDGGGVKVTAQCHAETLQGKSYTLSLIPWPGSAAAPADVLSLDISGATIEAQRFEIPKYDVVAAADLPVDVENAALKAEVLQDMDTFISEQRQYVVGSIDTQQVHSYPTFSNFPDFFSLTGSLHRLTQALNLSIGPSHQATD